MGGQKKNGARRKSDDWDAAADLRDEYVTIRVRKSYLYGAVCAVAGALVVLALQSAFNQKPPPTQNYAYQPGHQAASQAQQPQAPPPKHQSDGGGPKADPEPDYHQNHLKNRHRVGITTFF